MLVVVAFDYEDGDSLIFEAAQHGHRVIGRLRLYVAAVEEVARYQDEIYAAAYGVPLDHVSPGAEEIARPVGQGISFDAEVYVSHVKKSCHINTRVRRGLRRDPGRVCPTFPCSR